MRGFIKTVAQICTSSMKHLMPTILPQETVGYVIYSALVGYEGRCPVLAIVLGKFLFRKPSHIQDTFGFYLWIIDKGETLCKQSLPDADSDSTA